MERFFFFTVHAPVFATRLNRPGRGYSHPSYSAPHPIRGYACPRSAARYRRAGIHLVPIQARLLPQLRTPFMNYDVLKPFQMRNAIFDGAGPFRRRFDAESLPLQITNRFGPSAVRLDRPV